MDKHEGFKILYNIYDFCGGKEISSFEQEIFYFNRRTTTRMIPVIEAVCNLVQNGHFTKRDFIFYLLIIAMQKGKSTVFKIQTNKIKKTVKMFSIAQTTADHKFLNQLMEENNVKLEEMIMVKENGKSLIYELFQKNFISICLLLKYSKKLLTTPDTNIILDTDYKSFLRVLSKTTTFIKGVKHE